MEEVKRYNLVLHDAGVRNVHMSRRWNRFVLIARLRKARRKEPFNFFLVERGIAMSRYKALESLVRRRRETKVPILVEIEKNGAFIDDAE